MVCIAVPDFDAPQLCKLRNAWDNSEQKTQIDARNVLLFYSSPSGGYVFERIPGENY
jgi:hypothetical protein